MFRREVRMISVTTFYPTEYNPWLGRNVTGKTLKSIYKYCKADQVENDIEFHKEKIFKVDSTYQSIFVKYFYPISYRSDYFELRCEFYLNELTNTMSVDHVYNDLEKSNYTSIHLTKEANQDEGNASTVHFEHVSDTLEYKRTLKPSDSLWAYYLEVGNQFYDNLPLLEQIPLPNINSCSQLIESSYHFTKCTSPNEGLYEETWIDSIFVDGAYKIRRSSISYQQIDSLSSEGFHIHITKNLESNHNFEKRYFTNEEIPFYQVESNIDRASGDTIYFIEMHSDKTRQGRISFFNVIDNRSLNNKMNDSIPPIYRYHITLSHNKKGEIDGFNSIAFTTKEDMLQYAYTGTEKKRKTTHDIRKMPIANGYFVYQIYPEYISPSFKLISPIPSNDYSVSTDKKLERKNLALPDKIKVNSKRTESHRRGKFESRKGKDGNTILDVYYY
jgi:hypothetical protein